MYDHAKIEKKWQKNWQKERIYSPDLDQAKKPYYNLMMFPYPSAEGLHVGNMYAFVHSDCWGRYMRLKGFDVFEPIGLDGFGIHSENYAIKIGEHIKKVSERTEKRFYNQLKMIGNQYDWERKLETYHEDYYKWTQWLFLQLYKKGLAYRKKSPVNWCPSCKTVLSDEQVISGKCERCDSNVEKKQMEQWFFRITQYAEKLLKNLDWIDWSEDVKLGQKNWIGKSEGAEIEFKLKDQKEKIKVFTTRPDTIFGATYLTLAPEHEIIESQIKKLENKKDVLDYINMAKKKSEQDRINEKEIKTGVELRGVKAINPLTKKKIPIWIADYVLQGYGKGAIMGVPAHDQRDFEFAKKYNLEIKEVVQKIESSEHKIQNKDNPCNKKIPEVLNEIIKKDCFVGEGESINSGFLNGLKTKEAKKKIVTYLEKNKIGGSSINYKLRDWCVSRQRYWGPPIPMIYCEKCGWHPVPEKDLPVKLPALNDFHPDGSGKGPLNKVESFVNTTCPKCGGKASRETDVSDPFVDSSWYYFRYLNTENNGKSLNDKRIKKWMPIDMYIGGKEHTVLHLLYARFITMVFNDLGYCDFEEPFKRFFAHGLVIKDGAKMSKSKGNVVNPDEFIKRFGADSVRIYLMFLGDVRQGGDWKDTGMAGMFRFIKRLWKIYENFSGLNNPSIINLKSVELKIPIVHLTIKKVTSDLERLSFNTAVARIMELVNWYYKKEKELGKQEKQSILSILAILISPFAPHLGEEFWEISGDQGSVFKQKWPIFNKELTKQDEIEVIIQVNGKLRGQLSVVRGIKEEKIVELARTDQKIAKYLQDKKIKKQIFIPDKLVNFVVGE